MGRVYRLSGLRKAVAERLGYSMRMSLPVALMNDYDASNLIKVYNLFRERFGNEGPSITTIVTKVVGDLLKNHPMFNAVIEGDEVREMDDVNIAVAVETPRGLYAPTLKNVDKKTFFEIESELRRLTAKAVDGTITLNELVGHSFTVTNLGHLGVLYFTPIINPPDICILALGAIRREEDRVRGYLTLVFDHRVVDGGPAAEFLQEIKKALENLIVP